MEKAIFDTSIWVDFLKNIETPQTLLLEDYIVHSSDNLLLTPTIIQEILQGERTEKDFLRSQEVLESFNIISPNWVNTSIGAAKLYFTLRTKGVTIRKSNDCLIAQIAIENDILLVHNDIDLDQIAKNSELRTFKK